MSEKKMPLTAVAVALNTEYGELAAAIQAAETYCLQNEGRISVESLDNIGAAAAQVAKSAFQLGAVIQYVNKISNAPTDEEVK